MTGAHPPSVVAAALLAAVLAGPARSPAHGLSAEPVEGARAVRALYADGSPVAQADASVFAPGGDAEAVYTGTTDEQGVFAFRPATPGVWRIRVDDGMGHSVTREIPVGDASPPPAEPSGKMPRHYAVLTGLALIFGAFGWLAFLRSRAARSRAG